MEIIKKTVRISKTQDNMLKKLSEVSLKSESDLIREAIDLLFKTPGKDIIWEK